MRLADDRQKLLAARENMMLIDVMDTTDSTGPDRSMMMLLLLIGRPCCCCRCCCQFLLALRAVAGSCVRTITSGLTLTLRNYLSLSLKEI